MPPELFGKCWDGFELGNNEVGALREVEAGVKGDTRVGWHLHV